MDQRLVGPEVSNPPELKKDDREISMYINVLDKIHSSADIIARRVKEIYGWHFPELANIVRDGLLYVKTVKIMGTRDNAADLRFSEILPELEGVEAELKEAARTSSGTDGGEFDLRMTRQLCRRSLSIFKTKGRVHDVLRDKMNTVAPNLTALVGEIVGARLVALAGGMVSLGKMARGRIETLGPGRRGIIYDAPKIKQAPQKVKRKMARYLAAKCASAVRRDVYGTDKDNRAEEGSFIKKCSEVAAGGGGGGGEEEEEEEKEKQKKRRKRELKEMLGESEV